MSQDKSIAERIKVARSLAGYLNRRDFSTRFQIPYDTLDSWERGKNPLTRKGARRLVDALKSVGLYCTEEWLREGEGLSPRPFQEINLNAVPTALTSLAMLEENLGIATEVSTFITINQGAVVSIVQDDTALPFYRQGDYVGGVLKTGDEMKQAIGERCIVYNEECHSFIGLLTGFETAEAYELLPLSSEFPANHLQKNLGTIAAAAPILWHRKL